MSRQSLKQIVVLASLILSGLLIAGHCAKDAFTQDSVGALEPFWSITRGGSRADEGWGAAVDSDGNLYLTGFDRISALTSDVFLRKFTPDAVELWNITWGDAYDDKAYIVTTHGGYVYVGGSTYSSFSLTSADMFILKFHASNGSLVWSRTWASEDGYDEVDGIFVDENSIYLAGWTTGTSTYTDIAVQKYDVNGTLVWNHSWGTSGVDEANGQIGVDENYIFAVGHYNGIPPLGIGGDAVLVAFNKTDGTYAWHTTWGGDSLDDAFGMVMDPYYIYSVGITSNIDGDFIFLLKHNKTGSLIWNATWGGDKSEVARAVALNADNSSIYIAGNTMSYGSGDFDVILLRYDQNGNLTLSKTWGGTALEQAHGMAIKDPFIYVAGETASFGAGHEDAFLLKVDMEGGHSIPEFGPLTLSISAIVLTALTVYCKRKRLIGLH